MTVKELLEFLMENKVPEDTQIFFDWTTDAIPVGKAHFVQPHDVRMQPPAGDEGEVKRPYYSRTITYFDKMDNLPGLLLE